MVADLVEYWLGVDTHRDGHQVVVVDRAGRVVGATGIEATRRGYRAALFFSGRHAPGRRVWAIEGSGCYGAGLARFLAARGERVVEVERPARGGRGGRIKDDLADAERAARAAAAGTAGATPRLAARTQQLRVLVVTRDGIVRDRTRALNELHALLVTAPDELRERLAGRSRRRLLDACQALRGNQPIRLSLRLVAERIRLYDRHVRQLDEQIRAEVGTIAPQLLERRGVGPTSAAQILVAWSHHGRLRNEAAFSRLAGVAPIPASSGATIRWRLDRAGDRQLNRALHTIALTLRRCDPQTRAYIAQRQASGKTQREATRLLKRYLARSIYRQLEATTMP
jgi:transposase